MGTALHGTNDPATTASSTTTATGSVTAAAAATTTTAAAAAAAATAIATSITDGAGAIVPGTASRYYSLAWGTHRASAKPLRSSANAASLATPATTFTISGRYYQFCAVPLSPSQFGR